MVGGCVIGTSHGGGDARQVGVEIGAVELDAKGVRAGGPEHGIEHDASQNRRAVAVLEIVLHPALEVAFRRNRFSRRTRVTGEIP